MSIVTTVPAVRNSSATSIPPQSTAYGALLSAFLTPIAVLILGFHPYAEDGGLYLAGVEYLLNPSLFPHMRQFVTAPLRYSAFAPCVASLTRHSGLSFDTVVFAIFLLCLWATIFAAWCIARECFASTREQVGATMVAALWLSLPVAGTSLMLIDPYLTARSLSTPLTLLAIACALRTCSAQRSADRPAVRRSFLMALLWIALAALFHPLMAGYGAVFVLSAVWIDLPGSRSRWVRALTLAGVGLLFATAIQVASATPSQAVTRVALTRSYWFLAQWEWFEILGLIAPLIILAIMLRSQRFQQFRPLARSAISVGAIAIAVSLAFARSSLHSFGVSHLQPLRVFQIIYFALLLALGACLARLVLRDVWWRWALAILILSAPLVFSARLVFAHSSHLELPAHRIIDADRNEWVAAFRWIRQNTPVDSFFALDANYISDPEEDAQSFRAISERSVLPDYSKDGGETAVNTELGEAWQRGVDAQRSLSTEDDLARHQALDPLGVNWMVLRSEAKTLSKCPYDNGTVKVCMLDDVRPRTLTKTEFDDEHSPDYGTRNGRNPDKGKRPVG